MGHDRLPRSDVVGLASLTVVVSLCRCRGRATCYSDSSCICHDATSCQTLQRLNTLWKKEHFDAAERCDAAGIHGRDDV